MNTEVLDTYPKYDSYKDSEVDWLGQIPANWNTEKGKWLFTKMDRPIRENDGIITCFRDGEVTLRSNRRSEGFTNALKEHGYQGIRKGDLVIHQMDAFAGAIGVSDSNGKSTPVYSVCTAREPNIVLPEYYSYLLRNLAYSGYILSLAKGIRERSTDFRFNDFAKLNLPLPSIGTQENIVSFIKYKSNEIDQAIDLKQQQIEKLNEYKQIAIQNAVTKGLDANAKMKDSGIDWIGEIPAHWDLKKLKYSSKNYNCKVSSKESSFRYLGMENVIPHKGEINNEISEVEGLANHFKAGQVLFGKLRPYLSKVYLADFEGICSTEFMVFETNENLLPEFLKTIMLSNSFVDNVNSSTYGSKMPRANPDFINNQYIAVPSLKEQTNIVNHIKHMSSPVREAIKKYEIQIERLKEYKTILINQAVTGKIKVS